MFPYIVHTLTGDRYWSYLDTKNLTVCCCYSLKKYHWHPWLIINSHFSSMTIFILIPTCNPIMCVISVSQLSLALQCMCKIQGMTWQIIWQKLYRMYSSNESHWFAVRNLQCGRGKGTSIPTEFFLYNIWTDKFKAVKTSVENSVHWTRSHWTRRTLI